MCVTNYITWRTITIKTLTYIDIWLWWCVVGVTNLWVSWWWPFASCTTSDTKPSSNWGTERLHRLDRVRRTPRIAQKVIEKVHL